MSFKEKLDGMAARLYIWGHTKGHAGRYDQFVEKCRLCAASIYRPGTYAASGGGQFREVFRFVGRNYNNIHLWDIEVLWVGGVKLAEPKPAYALEEYVEGLTPEECKTLCENGFHGAFAVPKPAA